MTRLRPVEPADYERLAAIGTAIDPAESRGPDWYRERDASWNPRLLRYRLAAERDGLVVGWGELGHGWWAYHPQKFYLRLNVDPDFQRQGVGACLYSGLLDHVVANWNPRQISAEASEVRPWSVAFLQHRGFEEAHRRWDAALEVAEGKLERLPSATRRVADQGLSVVTLADERQRRGDHFARDLYEFEQRIYRDEPGYDPEGSLLFDQFLAVELNPETALDGGSFLALDGTRMVAISRLRRDSRRPGILHVGFTGVDAAYRGRGLALALKLLTIDYARQHGFVEIRTENDATNAPMLHINLELGFKLEPASVILHKPL
ncbi:MAG: GNAT family N-acetyltransferase [Chloroflexi bacterium]|nr:GNAT family N-acetyltransferase [Chloroflexota bacterium]